MIFMQLMFLNRSKYFFAIGIVCLLIVSSCGKPFVKKAPKDKYYLYKNEIEVTGGKLNRVAENALIERLYGQLDDSSKVKTSTKLIFFNVIKKPIVYDSNFTVQSANNMRASLFHLGYYNASIQHHTDTSQHKITVHYDVNPGKPTLIHKINYQLKKQDLQNKVMEFEPGSYLKINEPITKTAVITELNRLVDSFRNNGYYKFTSAELKVMGDTSIEALTSLNDDPFEQLRLIAEAQQKKDSPQIRLAVVLNPPSDSTRLQQYRIRNVYLLPDYRYGDALTDSAGIQTSYTKDFIIRYHTLLCRNKVYERNITLLPGMVFKQQEYYNTIYNLTKSGIWQTINIQVLEAANAKNLLDVVIQMTPNKKYAFETALELSYSASSNTSNILAGNLFGLSGNISLLNRNLAKEGIKMNHNIRAGIEFNNGSDGANGSIINSNELSYNNTTSFPRLLFAQVPRLFKGKREGGTGETFINVGLAKNTRLNLFELHTVKMGLGWTGTNQKNWKWSWSPLNTEFSNLLNQSDSFRTIVNENPFLKFSYNTAFVAGMNISFSKTLTNLPHPHSVSKEFSRRFNMEESGLTWGLLPIFNKYKRRYIKFDAEVKHTIKYNKTSLALRGFMGIGIPLLGSDTNRTLPFFKQYFGGGSNSMRAWPVRGIGPGGNPLIPFSSTKTIFNDRTGDMQLEANIEYRYDIARIIPNTLTLRGAIFTDIGNIWNLKNTKNIGGTDTAQFNIKNLYRQLGVSAGTGLRLDFSYFVVRLDFGFRFKRPELFYQNDGWKAPSISFSDMFKKIFTKGDNDEYRKWRYENFNFTIGIGYSF